MGQNCDGMVSSHFGLRACAKELSSWPLLLGWRAEPLCMRPFGRLMPWARSRRFCPPRVAAHLVVRNLTGLHCFKAVLVREGEHCFGYFLFLAGWISLFACCLIPKPLLSGPLVCGSYCYAVECRCLDEGFPFPEWLLLFYKAFL